MHRANTPATNHRSGKPSEEDPEPVAGGFGVGLAGTDVAVLDGRGVLVGTPIVDGRVGVAVAVGTFGVPVGTNGVGVMPGTFGVGVTVGTYGVAVGTLGVDVDVAVAVGVIVGVEVLVGTVGVGVIDVDVGVGVRVGVNVAVGVGVLVGVGFSVQCDSCKWLRESPGPTNSTYAFTLSVIGPFESADHEPFPLCCIVYATPLT